MGTAVASTDITDVAGIGSLYLSVTAKFYTKP